MKEIHRFVGRITCQCKGSRDGPLFMEVSLGTLVGSAVVRMTLDIDSCDGVQGEVARRWSLQERHQKRSKSKRSGILQS